MKNALKTIAVCVALTAALVGTFGYLSSGFESLDLTTSEEGAPFADVADAAEYVGWQKMYGSWDDNGNPLSYAGIGVNFTIDPEMVEKYEKQGYTVEYGVITAVGTMGTDTDTPTLVNEKEDLYLKRDADGKLVTKSENAMLRLAYSTDENAEIVDIIVDVENSPLVNLRSAIMFDGLIYIEGDQTNDNQTYLALAFVVLTDSNGNMHVEYIDAGEVTSIIPFNVEY